MNWLCEKDKLIDLIFNKKLPYDAIGKMYGITGNGIKKAAKKVGIKLPIRRKINDSETFNQGSGCKFICLNCGSPYFRSPSVKGNFCSKKCCGEYNFKHKIKLWKNGAIDGTTCYTCASYIKKYLMQKNNNKCQLCGWNKVNTYTNKIPLQIHHIDGNSCNNSENNLQLLCPNCHSLTENFGSRNKNATKGRSDYYRKEYKSVKVD